MANVDIYHMNIDVDLADVWGDADDWERHDVVRKNREWLIRALDGEANLLLEDPVKRLEVVVALRKLGYTVESA